MQSSKTTGLKMETLRQSEITDAAVFQALQRRESKSAILVNLPKGSPALAAFRLALRMSLDIRMDRVFVAERPPDGGLATFFVDQRSVAVLLNRLLREIPDLSPDHSIGARIAARRLLFEIGILLK